VLVRLRAFIPTRASCVPRAAGRLDFAVTFASFLEVLDLNSLAIGQPLTVPDPRSFQLEK
jgi:hypothetical protein